MGHSKVTKAQLANLSKASFNSHRPIVEEIPDSDDDEYLLETRWNDTVDGQGSFFFVEDYSDSDSDLDSVSDLDLEERDLDEDKENEIIDDVALLTFTNVLQRAQEITVEEENKKWGSRKRSTRPQFVPSNNRFRSAKSSNQEARNLYTPSSQRRRA